MPINSIQINATGTNISSQTTASSCVIAPIRTTIPVTANFSVPLLYDTTTREVFFNSQTHIGVDLITASTFTLNNNAYNRFIFINTIQATNNQLNLPTPLVQFPASITIFNNVGVQYTLGCSESGSRIRVGSSTSATTNVGGSGCIILHTNGTIWCRTSVV